MCLRLVYEEKGRKDYRYVIRSPVLALSWCEDEDFTFARHCYLRHGQSSSDCPETAPTCVMRKNDLCGYLSVKFLAELKRH
jgi:hypothetical protein